MANKMLIDATHPEETRVVVLRGNRVEEFDFESANRKQLRGNIYLAKVTRVEPSLQAAFVDYGGNRHGFLAFSEIHPDYYQIPVADRQALIDEEERAHRDAEAEADRRAGGNGRHHHRRAAGRRDDATQHSEPIEGASEAESAVEGNGGEAEELSHDGPTDIAAETPVEPMELAPMELPPPPPEAAAEQWASHAASITPSEPTEPAVDEPANHWDGETSATQADEPVTAADAGQSTAAQGGQEGGDEHGEEHHERDGAAERADEASENGHDGEEEEVVESVGGADVMEEVPDRVPRLRRQYKIQEVIKRRQIMLVQVVKEERGTKGAALTTYLSLAGRYSVLMPNTARGGGISRKITNFQDRKRLKEVAQELEVPEGMGVILRTAGAARTKPEIKRDFEYLMRMWETVRDVTLKSTAPTLVYEEGSLVKRSIRDLYNKDIDEVIVAGEASYREAHDFMRMLMPSHARNVKPYHETQPILTRFGIESQLDAMFSPVVQLRSGGYIVINQAEALVAIDVNSGRATREHHIEDTALKTNLEAADEIARQLRLRDLAGLIVIDFIDMDEKRNNRSVERRLKEALKHDRARIQVGRISHFGLLEMSRQRIRTSVLESSTDKCPHCGGTGHVRSVASVALQVLRMIEETLLRGGTHNLSVRTRSDIAIYVLNHKRAHLRDLEERFRIAITISADAAMGGQTPFMIERGEQVHSVEQARAIAAAQPVPTPVVEPEYDEEPIAEDAEAEESEAGAEEEAAEGDDAAEGMTEGLTEGLAETDDRDEMRGDAGGETGGAGDGGRRRRRRRRRGRRGEGREGGAFAHEAGPEHAGAYEGHDPDNGEAGGETSGEHGDEAEGGEHEAAHAGSGEPREHAPHLNGDGDRRRRRRGRRGGRRNRRDREGEGHMAPDSASDMAPDMASDMASGMTHGMDEVHEGQAEGHAEGPAPHGTIEPELAHAVADFGGPAVAPPTTNLGSEPAAPTEPPTHHEAAHAEPAAHEPPRRRSTVREPAPLAFDEGASTFAQPVPPPSAEPAPAPAAAERHEPAADDAAKPRRTGWWAKRVLGG
ncbi:MAG TPA: Rne/Rng family ribonuclease [Xanthobacteraceae bacterium]|nr:Rne/Rng family ribonuclease [Xanthobacteraceae bacterium]